MNDSYSNNYPAPKNRHGALQRRALDRKFHVIKARNFAAYKNTSDDYLGHVLIFDLAGNQLAGPFDLDRAERWIGGHS